MRYVFAATYILAVIFMFTWLLGGFSFVRFGKQAKQYLKQLPARIMRDPNDWRTPAAGGWRQIQKDDVCEDREGNIYTVRYSGKIGPADLNAACFGCLSVDEREGTITAHFQTGKDDRWRDLPRDLVRIVSRA